MSRLKLGVLASGTGTNFGAMARAISDGRVAADIAILLCNRPDAGVVTLAGQLGVETEVIDHRGFDSREAFDAAVSDRLAAAGVELVVMAGFDRLITAALLERFPDRIINIHPALLPAFKGVDAQTQAASYGVRVAGATVHLVDEHVDHGPIIVQAAVAVDANDDAETVRRRILAQEHRIYPWAVQLFAEGRVVVEGRKVVIRGSSAADRSGVLVSPALPDDF